MAPEPLCDTDPSEQGLVAAVVEHYRQCLASSGSAREALLGLGISPSVAKRFSLGLSDRSLGLRLPERNRRAGKHLRESLIALGIYRSSGHEHFVGSLVVPLCSPGGEIVGLCARRTTDNDDSALLFASGMAGGIFNEGAVKDEVVLTESVFDALAAISAGCEATLAPGRPGGFTRADLERLAGLGVRRAVLVGDSFASLQGRLGALGIEAVQVACGRSLHRLLASSPDASQAMSCLLGSAAFPPDPKVDEAEIAAVSDRKVSGDASELHVSFARRRWRVRGAERNKVPDSVRVSLLVSDTETGEFHLDALDLCVAKARAAFVQAASAELHADEALLRRELAEVLFATESILSARDAARAAPEMTEEERDDALELLRDPGLTARVIADLGSLGVVGEETNLLVAYLATISRISEHPFGVVVQSSSAAGKSTLADAVCQLVPEEDLASYSALTGQALYYLGAGDLSHKVLAVSEQQGAARALYALKLLLTEGRLSIASTGKDPASGRLRTRSYEVQGPVALVLTTTATELDPELSNRLVVLGVDEDQAQTRAIHAAQRRAASLEGLVSRRRKEALVLRHRNAQRLLAALPVVISGAEELSFPDHATRHRRDHLKLLSLICASALLHQHQRTRATVEVDGTVVSYLQADASDVALGLRLAEAVLQGADELAPQTRRLLAACEAHVAARADLSTTPLARIAFTRREIREQLGWSEHQVRVGLARLVALEYLLVAPGGPGRHHRYRLAELRQPRESPREVREPGSRGVVGPRAGETADPGELCDAYGDGGEEFVGVCVGGNGDLR
jgi:hypothetical protein